MKKWPLTSVARISSAEAENESNPASYSPTSLPPPPPSQSLEKCYMNTTTKTRVAYGNSHLACE